MLARVRFIGQWQATTAIQVRSYIFIFTIGSDCSVLLSAMLFGVCRMMWGSLWGESWDFKATQLWWMCLQSVPSLHCWRILHGSAAVLNLKIRWALFYTAALGIARLQCNLRVIDKIRKRPKAVLSLMSNVLKWVELAVALVGLIEKLHVRTQLRIRVRQLVSKGKKNKSTKRCSSQADETMAAESSCTCASKENAFD